MSTSRKQEAYYARTAVLWGKLTKYDDVYLRIWRYSKTLHHLGICTISPVYKLTRDLSPICHYILNMVLKRGHSVLGIANEFLRLAERDDADLTPMQLQKLCYLAHGFTLALFDKPLIKDGIEAWDWGPVFPNLYDAVKKYGARPVPDYICENNWAALDHVKGNVVEADLSPREKRLLKKVWDDYGEFEGFQLSALTHEEGSPWEQVYVPGKRNINVPDKLIKSYFRDLIDDDE